MFAFQRKMSRAIIAKSGVCVGVGVCTKSVNNNSAVYITHDTLSWIVP